MFYSKNNAAKFIIFPYLAPFVLPPYYALLLCVCVCVCVCVYIVAGAFASQP